MSVPRRAGSRLVRAEAHELVEVPMSVNGTPVTLRLPPRVTLADALRDHLGLTGTHLGCEHGVCGMCTVLVDGSAVRSCLVFVCQLDGSEVVTVEGLGRPDELHPLQEAFARHHALQCGFCTPGFLLSAYDLLTDQPEVTDQQLPQELSGVLCRCTGYRSIVAAVSETARAYPDGLPAPRNCGSRASLRRAASAPGTANTAEAEPRRGGWRVMEAFSGEPTFAVDVTEEFTVSLTQLWRVLDDIDLLARCLPGAELTEHLGNGRYRGRARVSVGPVRLSFDGFAEVVERDAQAHRMRVIGEGQDAGRGRAHVDIRLAAEEAGAEVRLRVHADVYLTGRIAHFGRGLAGDVSHRMFEQFAAAVQTAATAGAAPAPRKPPSTLGLVAGTLGGSVRKAVERLWQRLRS